MNRRITRLSIFSAALTAILLPFGVRASRTQEVQNPPVSSVRRIPFNRTLRTPCREKRIRLTGEFQVQYRVTRDAGGHTRVEGDINADKIVGSGLTSRARYKAVGTGRLESSGPSPASFTYVFNFALNKTGSNDSLTGHVRFRISVNAHGGVNTSIVDADVDCAT